MNWQPFMNSVYAVSLVYEFSLELVTSSPVVIFADDTKIVKTIIT